MLTTGFNDARVAPWQPGKMSARLQAASSSGDLCYCGLTTTPGTATGTLPRRRWMSCLLTK